MSSDDWKIVVLKGIISEISLFLKYSHSLRQNILNFSFSKSMIEDNDSEIISISNTSDTSQELDVEVKGIWHDR